MYDNPAIWLEVYGNPEVWLELYGNPEVWLELYGNPAVQLKVKVCLSAEIQAVRLKQRPQKNVFGCRVGLEL